MVRVDRAGARRPPDGCSSTTLPAWARLETACLSVCTLKPALLSFARAADGSRPTTPGTTFSAPGLGPSETLSCTRVPRRRVRPPAGACETTVPCGSFDGTETTPDLKPALVRVRCAPSWR